MATANAYHPPAAVPARFDRSTQHRRSMLAKINIARQQLAMDEDDYRQILFDQTGSLSLKELSDSQLDKVLGVMKAKGFRALPKSGAKSPAAQHPMARKARALWISLYHLGVVHNSSEYALEAFVCRQLKCEKLVWARQSDAYQLIEALKAMAKRNGWAQSDPRTGKPCSVTQLQCNLCYAVLDRLVSAKVADKNWSLEQAAHRLCGETTSGSWPFSAEMYARLAGLLGKKLRDSGVAGELA